MIFEYLTIQIQGKFEKKKIEHEKKKKTTNTNKSLKFRKFYKLEVVKKGHRGRRGGFFCNFPKEQKSKNLKFKIPKEQKSKI